MQLALPIRPGVAAGTIEVGGGGVVQLPEARSEGNLLGLEGPSIRPSATPRFSGPGLAFADGDEQR
jgi:hypothetical protein